MIEIDHFTLPQPQPEPEPAVPCLASHLLQLEEKQRTRFTRDGRPERLSVDCEDIDEMLGGGVERGIVMGISAEGAEGRLISLHLLASILLPHLSPRSSQSKLANLAKATIIDITGSFPLSLLAQVLKSRITASHSLSSRSAIQSANHAISRLKQSGQDPTSTAKIDKEVQKCLEMIAISRVFDIEGLWEVLGEIGVGTASPNLENEPSKEPAAGEKNSDGPVQSGHDWPEINDSEELAPEDEDRPALTELEDEGTEIIIVDNMTQIINELFSRKEKSDAHNLLTLLSRQIYSLSNTQNIITILHNTTSSSKPSYTNRQPHSHPNHPHHPNPHQQPYQQSQAHSLFPSNPLKPSLGTLFSQLPSLHLFTSRLPRTREDAELLYARDVDSPPLREGQVRYCIVVEVLRDECPSLDLGRVSQDQGGKEEIRENEEIGERRKFAYREQRWCAVEIPDCDKGLGTHLRGAFGMRGGMSGMGLKRRGIGTGIGAGNGVIGVVGAAGGAVRGTTETETEVGNVAKIWGFGGRRV